MEQTHRDRLRGAMSFPWMLPLVMLAACLRSAPLPPAPPPLEPSPLPPPLPAGAAVDAWAPTLEASAEILVVGDIMMHGSVQRAAAQANVRGEDGASTNFDGFGALFAAIKPTISDADLAFGNLEFPVAPDSGRGTASMVFNAPPAVLDALVDAGFDAVSFANNHVYDQGVKGFVETLARLDASGLDTLGAGADCDAAQSGRIYEINGIRIAFLAGSRLFNTYLEPGPGRGCVFRVTDERAVLARVAAARAAGAEIVLLSLHWGVEYQNTPHTWDVQLAHRLLDGGVDAIIGHHPHVLQPIEVRETPDGRQTFVIYSLGNFISGQGYHYRHGMHHPHVGNTRDGGLLRFQVVRKRYGPDLSRVELANLRFDPLWVERQASAPQTHTVVARLQAQALAAQLAALPEDDPSRPALQSRVQLLLDRRRHAASIVGNTWLLTDGDSEDSAILAADPGQ